MWLLVLISFLLLGGYLLLSAMRFGIPDMVSDTYYQLQNCKGSEIIGSEKKRNFGWVFSVVMLTVAILMMISLLDTERGEQFLVFIGCAGLAFVGCAPNYAKKEEYYVHKIAAIVAAVGCVGWCLSVNWWITLIVLAVYVCYLLYTDAARFANGMWHISNTTPKFHPWYWAEASAFVDMFMTYLYVALS